MKGHTKATASTKAALAEWYSGVLIPEKKQTRVVSSAKAHIFDNVCDRVRQDEEEAEKFRQMMSEPREILRIPIL